MLIISFPFFSESVCPKADYVSFNGVCYKDFAERKTYCDARQTCDADGGLLAMPKDSATNTFIHELGKANDKRWIGKDKRWIGLTHAKTERQWVFADGQKLASSAYINWSPGKPGKVHEDGEDCAEVGTAMHVWNDEPCSRTKGFVCQLGMYYDCNFMTNIGVWYIYDLHWCF